MKKTFLIAVAVLTTTLFSFAQNDDNNWSGTWGGGKKVKGEGAIITQDRAISNFTGVESNISADVFVKQAAAFKVTVEGQKNVLDLMKTEVKNGLLKISFEKGYSIRYKTQLKISVEAPSFERLGMSGSGNVKVEGALTGKNLKLECSGSGDFDIADLKVSSLDLDISGSGNMKIAGSVDNADLSISGSGDVKAGNLVVKMAKCHISGSGNILCNATEKLDAHVSGSGDIRYKGSPILKSRVSGSGDVRAE